MSFKGLITIAFLTVIFQVKAVQPKQLIDSEMDSRFESVNVDSLVQAVLSKSDSKQKIAIEPNLKDSTILAACSPFKVDSLILLGNPFFIELVYKGLRDNLTNKIKPDFRSLFYGEKPRSLTNPSLIEISDTTADQIVSNLRDEVRDKITRHNARFYIMTFADLPNPEENHSRYISKNQLTNVRFGNDDFNNKNKRRFVVRNLAMSPWQYKVSGLAQFSENSVSKNWYQGGYSNLAVLGILSAKLTYDDKKNIQWDNTGEWRLGFNSVAGDTLHWLSTNDDVLKINSKLGIKAGGNFFYSGSVDFSTQFFNSYNGLNSTVLKASFLTPVRLNIGVGIDYKYKKIFSLMLSPFSYKYIYANDIVHVNPNLFGIQAGKNKLSEIGSSLKATLSYPVTREIQLDSKFSFYTNYEKVEIDWETVCEMKINRFLSTRISINPRYDNTVILVPGQSAQLQFKQLLSVGFSHKFL